MLSGTVIAGRTHYCFLLFLATDFTFKNCDKFLGLIALNTILSGKAFKLVTLVKFLIMGTFVMF